MKLVKPVKATSRKNYPFTSAPAEAKVVTKSVLAPTPATAKTNGATEKTKAAPTPIAETKPVTKTVLAPTPAKASVTTEKPQAAPTPVAAARPTKKTNGTATIEAKVDVGFGNTLYLRGEGKGLNWNQGIPLACVDGSTWQWSGEANEKLKFKLLLNDAVWAKGEDLVIAPGQKLQVAPSF
jgi:hypothetical protein